MSGFGGCRLAHMQKKNSLPPPRAPCRADPQRRPHTRTSDLAQEPFHPLGACVVRQWRGTGGRPRPVAPPPRSHPLAKTAVLSPRPEGCPGEDASRPSSSELPTLGRQSIVTDPIKGGKRRGRPLCRPGGGQSARPKSAARVHALPLPLPHLSHCHSCTHTARAGHPPIHRRHHAHHRYGRPAVGRAGVGGDR